MENLANRSSYEYTPEQVEAMFAALGAEKAIIFISDAHKKFYYEKLNKVRYQDENHKVLCYCLGISDNTRRNINRIYDFKTGFVKTECLREGWQTSGSVKGSEWHLTYGVNDYIEMIKANIEYDHYINSKNYHNRELYDELFKI